MVRATANSNFHSLAGSALPTDAGAEFKEYRRCWHENPKNFILRDFPIHIDIEVTNRCNLRCTFCDKLPLLKPGQIGDMDLSLYREIIDEGSEHSLWGAKLSYRGESLMHPDIIEMVSYAKKKGILDLYLNTNGMLLKDGMADRLIDAGLDRISISVDGTDPAEFEKMRKGARFDAIMRNIDRLMDLRQKKNAPNPKIRVQTVRLPSIDLEEYTRFWSSRCDEVATVDYKISESRTADLIEPDFACPQLWQRMTIEWNGDIIPCNNDDYRRLSPGNVKTKSVHECWHDSRVREARELHKKGLSHAVEACNGCPWRTTQILKNREEK